MGNHMALNDHQSADFMDGGREGVAAFGITMLAGFIGLTSYDVPFLGLGGKIIVVFAVAAFVMFFVSRFFARRNQRRRTKENAAFRADMQKRKDQELANFIAEKTDAGK